jgi:hypothetical protein
VTEPNSASTVVATREQGREQMRKAISPEAQRAVEENKARNALIQQIRGTTWSKELNADTIRAVAQYCRENNLDAVRHVEVLGGRIYLTADFYDERGASFIRDGIIQPMEPDYINADTRLDELAQKDDGWAKEERERRLRARIQFNVPESAKAAVVQRFRITATGAVVTGVNWCGVQGGKKDPVGDAEPAKTAQTRARRRAWRQIADVIPQYGAVIHPIEARAAAIAPVAIVEPTKQLPRERENCHGAALDAYLGGDGSMPRIVPGQAADGPSGYGEESDEQIRAFDQQLKDEENERS